jgi:cytochrome c oxidase subunit II
MMSFMILLVIILVAFIVARMIRIFELAADLKGEDPNAITDGDNRTQSTMFFLGILILIGYVLWSVYRWAGNMLPVSASEHGLKTDMLLNISFAIIIPMFVLCHFLLGYFAYKYAYSKERAATFFVHSTKLEMIWTVVPTVVLTTLIIYGIQTWNKITGPAPEAAMVVEIYAKQFDWTVRYSGEDNKLGRSGYRLIEGANIPGVDMNNEFAQDDKMVKGEFHLPVGVPVEFILNSRDVLHSAYMPHFRSQMNCVPGMPTRMHMIPTITTEEMRAELGNEEFDYLLLCNKICGSAHYNMQMKIVVETQAEYDAWYAGKKTMAEQLAPSEDKPAAEVKEASSQDAEDEHSEEHEGEENHEEQTEPTKETAGL